MSERFELPPYANGLGMRVESAEDGAPVVAFEFDTIVEGRPGYVQGGALSGLLEVAGYAAVRARLREENRETRLKPINFSVNFLRGGVRETTYAVGRVTRLGRKNANVSVEAWQSDRDRPIAEAVMNILLARSDGDDR